MAKKLKDKYLQKEEIADKLEEKIQSTISSSDLVDEGKKATTGDELNIDNIDFSFPSVKNGKNVLIDNEIYKTLKFLSIKKDTTLQKVVNSILLDFIEKHNIDF